MDQNFSDFLEATRQPLQQAGQPQPLPEPSVRKPPLALLILATIAFVLGGALFFLQATRHPRNVQEADLEIVIGVPKVLKYTASVNDIGAENYRKVQFSLSNQEYSYSATIQEDIDTVFAALKSGRSAEIGLYGGEIYKIFVDGSPVLTLNRMNMRKNKDTSGAMTGGIMMLFGSSMIWFAIWFYMRRRWSQFIVKFPQYANK